ncbi:hypothetical protein [Algoriphagus sp. AK58]|uniref:hypothetical protein n=1 Tax=Algoriphagus sp. AK58 TaxID=1406877 RepID=UPI00165079E2|nr:hypothetical protein [Algoriphagus sp. AK58]MBC6368620.1 hypothetical protein [Algoriphagus sp. AK58]
MNTKSTHSFTLLGVISLGLLLGACQDEIDAPLPEISEIKHEKLVHPEYFTYGTPKVIDLDRDGTVDFQFGVTLMGNELGDHYQFVISPVRSNTALVNESEVIPLEEGFEIGASAQQNGRVWDIGLGKFQTKLQKQIGEPSWSGNWSTIPDGLVGIRFSIDNKNHYGWIKIASDPYSSRMAILEYAFRLEPEKSIQSGQTK